jgi:hypothetical protein
MKCCSREMRALTLLLALGSVISIGCYGRPAPQVVRAGTTLAFGMGMESQPIGYGTLDIPDPQRGYTQFRLYRNDSNNWGTFVANLKTRLVTRGAADPASQGVIEGIQDPFGFGGTVQAMFQVIAIVDIPANVASGTYRIKSFRYRDPEFTTALDNGPGDSNQHEIEIITSTEEDFTAFVGTTASAASIVPWPKLILNFPTIPDAPWPAAATIRLTVPSRINVRGVSMNESVGNGAFVTFSSPSTNVVEIHYANPESESGALSLVFDLESWSGDYDPVATSEFAYQSGSFYDADGNPLIPPANYNPVGQIR